MNNILKKRKYWLDYKFDLFLSQTSEKFYIKGLTGVLGFFLPSLYFIKEYISELKEVVKKFLFTKKYFYKSFINHFIINYNYSRTFYMIKMKLKGLGFRIINYCKKLYSFFFNYTNYTYFHLPYGLYVKSYKKKIVFISPNNCLLKKVFTYIMNLKLIGPYFKRGWRYKRQLLILQKKTKVFI